MSDARSRRLRERRTTTPDPSTPLDNLTRTRSGKSISNTSAALRKRRSKQSSPRKVHKPSVQEQVPPTRPSANNRNDSELMSPGQGNKVSLSPRVPRKKGEEHRGRSERSRTSALKQTSSSFPQRCPSQEPMLPSTDEDSDEDSASVQIIPEITPRKRPSGAAPLPSKKKKISDGNALFLEQIRDLKERNKEQELQIQRLKSEKEKLLATTTALKDTNKSLIEQNNELKVSFASEKQLDVNVKDVGDVDNKTNTASLADALQSTKRQVVELQYQLSVLAQDPSGGNKSTPILPQLYQAQWTILTKECSEWAIRETQEVHPNSIKEKPFVRKWENRASEETTHPAFFHVIPRSPLELAALGTFYTPSFLSMKDFTNDFVNYMFKNNEILKSMTNSSDENRCIEFFSHFDKLQKKMKKALSDGQTVRKRTARDQLLHLLGWDDLCSRRFASASRTKSDMESTERLISQLRDRMRCVHDDGSLNYGHWRTANMDSICADSHKNKEQGLVSDDGDELFADHSRVSVFKAFLGYDPDASPQVHGTVLSLARLDAWIVTVVEMMGKSKSRGGTKQREFQGAFAKHLLGASKHLLQHIARRVMEHNSIPSAIVKIVDKENKKMYKAVEPTWFNVNISTHLGYVMDCFVVEYYKVEEQDSFRLKYSYLTENEESGSNHVQTESYAGSQSEKEDEITQKHSTVKSATTDRRIVLEEDARTDTSSET